MEHSKTRMIAEAGVAIAIAQVLSFITLFHMPQGGSIKAASMVPLMIFAYRWGGARGILAGVVSKHHPRLSCCLRCYWCVRVFQGQYDRSC